VAALEIMLTNRRLARELARAGITAVTTPADRLALSTLELYLSLSARAGRSRTAAGRPVPRQAAKM